MALLGASYAFVHLLDALAAVALIAWGACRFFSATQGQLKAAAARSQAADKSV